MTTDEAQAAAAPVPVPTSADLNREGLRVAIAGLRQDDRSAAWKAARTAAEQIFAVARRHGTPQHRVTLGDGTELGLVSIEKGATHYAVNEGELLLLIAMTEPSQLEDYVDPSALTNPRIIEALAEHVPQVVKRRIRPARRAELLAELEDQRGHVLNQKTGELVEVAAVTDHEATGKFSYSPDRKKAAALRAALDAGLITEEGEIVTPRQAAPAPMATVTPPAAPPARKALATAKADFPLTNEQEAIREAVATGDNTVVVARAGTGKTSTLRALSADLSRRKVVYVVYNAANAKDARGTFPRNVRVSTAHGLAKGAVGHRYEHRLNNSSRQSSRQVATILGITSPAVIGDSKIAPDLIARMVTQTTKKFCLSAEPELAANHVPMVNGLTDDGHRRDLADVVLPFARRAWEDIRALDGQLRFEHDYYLKMWQLTNPMLPFDVILWDEVQDADPAVLDVMTTQSQAQIVPVGDPCQAIYGWRGAVDAMGKFPGARRLTLSQSFRFGPAIAREANKWLTVLGATPLLRGYDRISSMSATLEDPDAILCRTNAEATVQAMKALEAGRDTAIVGGGAGIRWLAEACLDLKNGRGTSHPELFAFGDWTQVQDYAENEPGGSDLAVFVRLIDDHGPEKIMQMADQLTDEADAQTVVSTAHKSKGREWDSVKIAADFPEPKADPERPDDEPEISRDAAMLAYVAVTRARLTLDRSGLAWVDNYLPEGGEVS